MPYITAEECSDAEAYYYLGMAYQSGDTSQNIPYDLVEAERLLGVAAEAGNLNAIMTLARQYYYGLNVKKNPKESERLYLLAAQRGNSEAQFEMGNIYVMNSRENPADDTNIDIAIDWWNKAAINGSAIAHKALVLFLTSTNDKSGLYRLAQRYYEIKQKILALEVWERGAELGDPNSQYRLGIILCEDGKQSEGMDWLDKAVAAGHEDAKKYMRAVYDIDSELDSVDSV